MDFSQNDLIKMSQGIARLRQKHVLDPSDATAAIDYFSRISNHVNQKAILVELAKCQNCGKDVPAAILYEFDAPAPFKTKWRICPDCLIYTGSE
jgi:hypothetical protein